MDEKEKAMLFASVGKLENSLKKLAESAKEKSADIRCRTGRRSWVHDGVPCAQNDRFCMIDTKFTLCHFSA